MSNSKMLIDATHPEETRVVVQRNGRVEEFDFESAARKLLRGNIYLAKVTRVEPSLQAAFVDYGGNRHGFLAFNEIHPDYYQIPVADRQALLEEEAAAEAELEAAADRRAEAMARHSSGSDDDVPPEEGAGGDDPTEQDADSAAADPSHIVDVEEEEHIEEIGGETSDEDEPNVVAAAVKHSADDERSELPRASWDAATADDETGTTDSDPVDGSADETASDAQTTESEDLPAQSAASESDDQQDDPEEGQPDDDAGNGGDVEKAHHERSARPRRRPRSYKIQEVIKRRQIILVQVVKEERGNKGAALTTYLSLAGRYTVLMPNTARGGGISRKITNPQDRRRLKAIAQDLEVPEGMGLIIRTAGAARTKQEIKRDFEYLLRLWENVRELTLQSTAPNLVYEEGDLIKRSIRDLYNKEVEEIVVAGDAGFQEAAAFMKMLMPSHARNVMAYGDPSPLFTRYGVERQLNAMFQPQVTLKSGGYIVINQTEALVAIDVNSGKSTREFSIEETALATNLEAADEIARQLKLRDLAGLIVIDFIDMEEKRNNRAVERRLKDALRFDRARIQLGRISHFGLMEMSRQRLRTGVLEGSTSQCPHCMGTGIIRSTESIALAVLRGIEDAITAGATGPLIATTTPAVALYILNSKRPYVADMEARHGYTITVLGSDRVHGANFTVERSAASVAPRRVQHTAVNMDWGFDTNEDEASPDGSKLAAAEYERDDEGRQSEDRDFEGRRMDGDEGNGRRGRRRRRRGRGGRDRTETRDSEAEIDARPHSVDEDDAHTATDEESSDQPTIDADAYGENGSEGDRERPVRRRRRGRRGGRRGRDRKQGELAADADDANVGDDASSEPEAPASAPDEEPAVNNGTGTSRKPSRRKSEAKKSEPDPVDAASTDAASDVGKTQRQRRIWDAPSADNGDDEQPAQPAAAGNGKQPEAVEEPDAAPPQPARRRHESGSSEPRLERVVVKPGEREDNDVAELQATPQRKGWWQRKFGGD